MLLLLSPAILAHEMARWEERVVSGGPPAGCDSTEEAGAVAGRWVSGNLGGPSMVAGRAGMAPREPAPTAHRHAHRVADVLSVHPETMTCPLSASEPHDP